MYQSENVMSGPVSLCLKSPTAVIDSASKNVQLLRKHTLTYTPTYVCVIMCVHRLNSTWCVCVCVCMCE